MSSVLFLLAIDWVTRKKTADKRRGIRWKFTTVLEGLDVATFLSSRFNDVREKTERLDDEAARVGLKLNERKCRTLKTEYATCKERIMLNGKQVEDVEGFVYLGTIVGKEGRRYEVHFKDLQRLRRCGRQEE